MDQKLLTKINKIRKKGNFQTVRKNIGEERLKEFINSIYPKFSITEIEAITGIPDSTLSYWFEQLDIPFIRNHIVNIALPGDRDTQLVVTEGAITKKISTIKITPELVYVIGFSLGDGSIQKYMVAVFNKDRKLREVLLKFLKQYGSVTEDEREDGLWRLRLSNGKIANLIKDEKGIRNDTLDYIFNDEKLAKQFIAAFWDAEGSVLHSKYNYYYIYLYNSNNIILKKVGEFFRSKNIKFSIINLKSRKEKYFLKDRQVNPRKTLQRITIPRSSFLTWAKEIGIHLNHSKKREVVKEILNYYGGKKNDRKKEN